MLHRIGFRHRVGGCVVAVLLVSSLAWPAPHVGRAQDAAVPSGVESIASLEAPITEPTEPRLSLRLSRLTLQPGELVRESKVADPHLIFVETGVLTVARPDTVDQRYAAGSGVALAAKKRFTLLNTGDEPVTFVLFGLEYVSETGAVPPRTALLTATETIFTARVDSVPFPARLFLFEVSWGTGIDTGMHAFPGPVGFLVESGSLAVTGSTGAERQLTVGKHAVCRAGGANRQRNSGSEPAIVLVAGIFPADAAPASSMADRGSVGITTVPPASATPTAEPQIAATATPEAEPTSKPSTCDDRFATNPVTIAEDGIEYPFEVWVSWSPYLVIGRNCRAWIFFSAQTRYPDQTLGTKKLYVARFDPKARAWQPATAMPGRQIQFGPSAIVDAHGTVHLVYSDRSDDGAYTYSQLMYVKSTADGGWTDPVAVAPNPWAGHQLSPDLIRDRKGHLHVVWQDQRSVDDAARAAAASNADIFESDLGSDGVWTEPVQLSSRPDATTNGSRPRLASDGDRLVAVWSVYDETSGLDTAARLEWSSRPLANSAAWTKPRVLLRRGDGEIGGRLLDLASDPSGGVALVYGSHSIDNTLSVRRLEPNAKSWSAPITLITGDRGSYPAAAYTVDGTLVVVYNEGSGDLVDVGLLVLPAGNAKTPSTTVLTTGEPGASGRAVVAIDADGDPWIAYFHEPTGGLADAVWCQRNVPLPNRD